MSEDTTSETSSVAPEVVAAAGATGTAPEAPTNIVPMPAPESTENAPTEAPAKPEPKNIQELIASIDLKEVSVDEIVVDLIAGIQQLAVRGTIALGLLERLHVAANSEPAPEATPAAE